MRSPDLRCFILHASPLLFPSLRREVLTQAKQLCVPSSCTLTRYACTQNLCGSG